MSVYIATGQRVEDAPKVRYLPKWDNRPTVALGFGRTTIYVDADTARRLADDILTALDGFEVLP